MENHDWSAIKGRSSAPYINGVLLPMAAHAEQYYNPPGLHPSLPNYLWFEAGTNFGVRDDGDPSQNHQPSRKHLVTLLQRAGISWKAYEEGISGKTCPLTTSGLYAAKHDPMVYFDDVTGSRNPRSLYCLTHVRPYSELGPDLKRNTIARYNFITPNLCNDMHDACPPVFDSIKQGDLWLSRAVPAILQSLSYRAGGAVLITWDEGEGDDGPIGMIVLSPYAKDKGYANGLHYTHSSTLRTIEEIFGLRPLLGDAAKARDLRALFKRFP